MITRSEFLTSLLAALGTAGTASAEPAYDQARRAMVSNIDQLLAAGAAPGLRRLSPAVRAVLLEVPRHLFVPEVHRGRAHGDSALPIGHDATISQPLMVAAMTDLLELAPEHRVLEVGTGSGYQAAVLSKLAREVFSIEIVEPLARSADARLQALGYRATVRAGDGYKGWPEHAPFDRIMVTAGASHVPAPLVAQLRPGGRMLIPMGPDSRRQQLTLVTRDARGRTYTRRLFPVHFIPLQESR